MLFAKRGAVTNPDIGAPLDLTSCYRVKLCDTSRCDTMTMCRFVHRSQVPQPQHTQNRQGLPFMVRCFSTSDSVTGVTACASVSSVTRRYSQELQGPKIVLVLLSPVDVVGHILPVTQSPPLADSDFDSSIDNCSYGSQCRIFCRRRAVGMFLRYVCLPSPGCD
jgi:hypothetical protein